MVTFWWGLNSLHNSLPVGILVKESLKSVYYSDEEYHEAMV